MKVSNNWDCVFAQLLRQGDQSAKLFFLLHFVDKVLFLNLSLWFEVPEIVTLEIDVPDLKCLICKAKYSYIKHVWHELNRINYSMGEKLDKIKFSFL